MNKKVFLIILFAFAALMSGQAQEYLTGFNGGIPKNEPQKSRDDVVVSLPFFDDFTNQGKYPDASKWQSRDVFVNSGFPKLPVNYRAATLDVIDEFGEVYSNGSSNPFIADSLMSVKIRLDSLNGQALSAARDSLYLSFYYQPGGYGNCPDRDDSLVLHFGYGYNDTVYDSVSQHEVIERKTAWKWMWATPGQSLDTFVSADDFEKNKLFKQVLIPITDSCFYVEDFRILFYNYGTLPTTVYPNDRSNTDHWNIDLVRIDRRDKLSEYNAVGISEVSKSLLKRYQAMPYKHFKDNPINEYDNTVALGLSNMYNNWRLVDYSCEVEDNNSSWRYVSDIMQMGVGSYNNDGVILDTVVMENFIYPYNLDTDTTSFTIKHKVSAMDPVSGEIKSDSVVYHQGFYNYFAYDDGTPEKGYGLVPDDTYMAVQFKVSRLDTLGGVQMLFNRTFNDANYNFFDIVVWRDNNGKPGEIIYTLEDQRPEWDDNLIYNFSYYKFDEIVKVNSTFYVGLRQQYTKSINIGFDSNHDNSMYNFYDAGEGWKNSSFPGSIMIRPVMGANPYFIGVDEYQEVEESLAVYPNPAQNVLHLEGINSNNCKEVVIYDLTGRAVKHYDYCEELNVGDLTNGVYMLKAVKVDGSSETVKLLISK